MPIYAYRCAACGHAKDVLQKISDPVLSTCPACGADAFQKQLTAAGFQLKGSGWYVTDFKGGANGAKPADTPAAADAKPADAKPADGQAGATKPADSAAAGSSAPSGGASPGAAAPVSAAGGGTAGQ
jgi:putative FmdB family regulatory protein